MDDISKPISSAELLVTVKLKTDYAVCIQSFQNSA